MILVGETSGTSAGDTTVSGLSTLETIALALNVTSGEVVDSTDSSTILNPEEGSDVLYIFDAEKQTTYGVPPLTTTGEAITQVDGYTLTTTGGTYLLTPVLDNNYYGVLNKSISKKMLDGETVNIAILGDSITWGSNGNNTGVQVDKPYPTLLQTTLRAFYANENITVTNNGTSGYDTQNTIDNTLVDIVAQDSDLYLIGLGVNDARTDRGIDVTQYKDNLLYIYSQLSFASVAFVSPTEISATGAPNSNGVDDYRQTMKKVANANKCQYIDIWSEMQNLLANRGEARGKINRDRIHWSQEGYQLIADQVFIKGFANYNLKVQPDQFIDCASQLYRGADLDLVVANSQYTVAKKLSASETASLFIYVDNNKPCDLVMHASLYLVTGTASSYGVTVQNTSINLPAEFYDLTIVGAANNTNSLDYPISVCKLRKGLNIISLTTDSTHSCVVQGFSILARESASYMITAENALVSDKYVNTLEAKDLFVESGGFRTIVSPVCVGGVNDAMTNLTDTLPLYAGDETTVRIRGYFSALSTISLVQAAGASTSTDNWVSDYIDTIKINIRSTTTHIYHVNALGNNTELGVVSSPGSTDMVLDITTSSEGTSFYRDGTLIVTIPVKLGVGRIAIYNENDTTPTVIESVAILGSTIVAGEDVAGEHFYLHDTFTDVVVGVNGVRKTSTYS